MMASVKISYRNLHEAAEKMNAAKGDLEQAISSISGAVNAMGGLGGEPYDAFVSTWNDSEPTVKKLTEAAGRFALALNKLVALLEEGGPDPHTPHPLRDIH